MNHAKRIKFASPDEFLIGLTRLEIKMVIRCFPYGLTVPELVNRYVFVFKKDLPIHGFLSHQLLLEAMPDIVKFNGDLVLLASNSTDEDKAEVIPISRDWTKNALNFMLSSWLEGLSFEELKNQFQKLYFLPLPLLDYPNHRLMIESFSDTLVIRNERVYLIGLDPDFDGDFIFLVGEALPVAQILQ